MENERQDPERVGDLSATKKQTYIKLYLTKNLSKTIIVTMDPKLSNLDPKLQDAYNRVMGGPTPTAPAGGTVPPPTAPSQPVSPQPAAPQVPTPTPVTPTVAADPPAQPQASSFGGTLAFNANNAGKNQGTTVGVKKGGSKIMSLVLALGVIILLIAYTFVWIYVFKLDVPFLPKF